MMPENGCRMRINPVAFITLLALLYGTVMPALIHAISSSQKRISRYIAISTLKVNIYLASWAIDISQPLGSRMALATRRKLLGCGRKGWL